MPLPPPVMMATFPSNLGMVICSNRAVASDIFMPTQTWAWHPGADVHHHTAFSSRAN
jgi:hypothetical protein